MLSSPLDIRVRIAPVSPEGDTVVPDGAPLAARAPGATRTPDASSLDGTRRWQVLVVGNDRPALVAPNWDAEPQRMMVHALADAARAAILSDWMGRAWVESTALAEVSSLIAASPDRPLRLTLELGAACLLDQPWELLPLGGRPLWQNRQVVLRVGLMRSRSGAPEAAERGRVLVAWFGDVLHDTHVHALKALLGSEEDAERHPNFALQTLPDCSLAQLALEIRREPPVLAVHLLAQAVRVGAELQVRLGDGPASGAALATALTGEGRPPWLLTLLLAANANGSGSDELIRGPAEAIHAAGLPLVVTSRQALPRPTMARVALAFWRELIAAHAPVELAFAAAGAEVHTRDGRVRAPLVLYAAPGLASDHRPLARRPHPGRRAYGRFDTALFPQRAGLVERTMEGLGGAEVPVVLLHGPARTGRSSFLQAGLLPRLAREGWRVHVHAPGGRSTPAPADDGRHLLVLDLPRGADVGRAWQAILSFRVGRGAPPQLHPVVVAVDDVDLAGMEAEAARLDTPVQILPLPEPGAGLYFDVLGPIVKRAGLHIDSELAAALTQRLSSCAGAIGLLGAVMELLWEGRAGVELGTTIKGESPLPTEPGEAADRWVFAGLRRLGQAAQARPGFDPRTAGMLLATLRRAGRPLRVTVLLPGSEDKQRIWEATCGALRSAGLVIERAPGGVRTLSLLECMLVEALPRVIAESFAEFDAAARVLARVLPDAGEALRALPSRDASARQTLEPLKDLLPARVQHDLDGAEEEEGLGTVEPSEEVALLVAEELPSPADRAPSPPTLSPLSLSPLSLFPLPPSSPAPARPWATVPEPPVGVSRSRLPPARDGAARPPLFGARLFWGALFGAGAAVALASYVLKQSGPTSISRPPQLPELPTQGEVGPDLLTGLTPMRQDWATAQGVACVDSGALIARGSELIRWWGPSRPSSVVSGLSGGARALSCTAHRVAVIDEQKLRVFTLVDGQLLPEMDSPAHGMRDLRLDPTGQLLAATDGESLHVWDFRRHKPVRRSESIPVRSLLRVDAAEADVVALYACPSSREVDAGVGCPVRLRLRSQEPDGAEWSPWYREVGAQFTVGPLIEGGALHGAVLGADQKERVVRQAWEHIGEPPGLQIPASGVIATWLDGDGVGWASRSGDTLSLAVVGTAMLATDLNCPAEDDVKVGGSGQASVIACGARLLGLHRGSSLRVRELGTADAPVTSVAIGSTGDVVANTGDSVSWIGPPPTRSWDPSSQPVTAGQASAAGFMRTSGAEVQRLLFAADGSAQVAPALELGGDPAGIRLSPSLIAGVTGVGGYCVYRGADGTERPLGSCAEVTWSAAGDHLAWHGSGESGAVVGGLDWQVPMEAVAVAAGPGGEVYAAGPRGAARCESATCVVIDPTPARLIAVHGDRSAWLAADTLKVQSEGAPLTVPAPTGVRRLFLDADRLVAVTADRAFVYAVGSELREEQVIDIEDVRRVAGGWLVGWTETGRLAVGSARTGARSEVNLPVGIVDVGLAADGVLRVLGDNGSGWTWALGAP